MAKKTQSTKKAPKSRKAEKPKTKKKVIIGVSIGAGVAAIAGITAAIVIANSQPKEVELTTSQEIAVNSMVIAALKSQINSTGSITKKTCEEFRTLAKSYDKNTDWFESSYCNYIIRADYDKTENTTIITMLDGKRAATYTFDADRKKLIDFKFTESAQKGYYVDIRNSD